MFKSLYSVTYAFNDINATPNFDSNSYVSTTV